MLLAQLDIAIELLAGEPDERTVHETRKALKRVRALLRLLRDALPGKRLAHENANLRDAARRLAGTRDAEVLLDTLDALVARHPELFSRSRGVESLRAQLLAERERARAQTLRDAATREAVREQLRASRERLAKLRCKHSRRRARAALRSGLRRLYRQGRRRGRHARREGSAEAVHEWRKRVKDLRYAAEALAQLQGAPRKRRRRLRRIARRADRLGEALGEDHDLALLAAYVRAHAEHFAGERATQTALLKAIARRRRRLRTRAREQGPRLYRRAPSSFVRRTLGS